MRRWSILIECDTENIAQFNDKYLRGYRLEIQTNLVQGIIICDESKEMSIIE